MSEQATSGSSDMFKDTESDVQRLEDIGKCYRNTCLGKILVELSKNPDDTVLRAALSVARLMLPIGLGSNAVCGRSGSEVQLTRSDSGTPTGAVIEHCPESPNGFIFTIEAAGHDPATTAPSPVAPTPVLPEGA